MNKDIHATNVVDLTARQKTQDHGAPQRSFDDWDQALSLEGFSEEQKKEFLKALWSIIVSFVDLGYGIHPTHRSPSPDGAHREVVSSIVDYQKKAA